MKSNRHGKGKYAVAELRESYLFRIPEVGILNEYKVREQITSEVFNICGTDWEIVLTPKLYDSFGDDSLEQFCAIHLVHLADKTVRVGYVFSIENPFVSGPNWEWKELEGDGVVDFEAVSTGNSRWGTEEFIPLNILQENYVINDALEITVTIEIFGEVELSSHPLTKAIESAAKTDDLIRLADADLSLITKALPTVRPVQDINKQQDHIIKSRIHQHRIHSLHGLLVKPDK